MRVICEHIYKNFNTNSNNELNVLEDITIETEECDFVVIVGPNGCGKTTLLKIMAGILRPSSGNVYYLGNNHKSIPASLIFQEQSLFPWLNVIDNICFNLEMNGLSKKERYKRAEEFIRRMGLTKFIEYYPHQLSAGMKQKVSLIRGLLMDSEILLVDEPDTSLDAYSKLIVQEDIYKIWVEWKKTIVYVTHDVEGALHFAKNIWIMSKAPAKIIKKFNIASYRGNNNQLLNLKNEIIGIIHTEAQKESEYD